MRLLDVYPKAQDTCTSKGKRIYEVCGTISQEAGILTTESDRMNI